MQITASGSGFLEDFDLFAHRAGESFAAPVRGLADDLLAVLFQGAAHAGPATAAVRIGLIEYGNAPAVDAHEIID